MRLVALLVLSFACVSLAFTKGPDEVIVFESKVSRAESVAFASKLALAGQALDQYLKSDAAKNFDPEAEGEGEAFPSSVTLIFAELEDPAGDSERAIALAASVPLFALCDAKYDQVELLRRQWSARLFALAQLDKGYGDLAIIQEFGRLEVLDSLLDSWIALGAAHVGCPVQPLQFLERMQVRTPNDFASALLSMSQSGLMLELADGSSLAVDSALKLRSKALRDVRLGYDRFAAGQGDYEDLKEFKHQVLDMLERHEQAFQGMTAAQHTPIWRVDMPSSPKVAKRARPRCGTVEVWQALSAQLLMPNWPTGIAVLRARGADEAAAAYALAQLFEGPQELIQENDQPGLWRPATPQELVWRAYGKATVQAELERAAKTISLSAERGGVATVQVFGHSFLLTSGEADLPELSKPTRWYTQAEIAANFRNSHGYRALIDLAD